ncbi:MAG: beta-galactosidase [Planctomycetes bacterium]|nr:beta-galactosidase [Planctomycetota bacterium]
MKNGLFIGRQLIWGFILFYIFPIAICSGVEFNRRFAPHQGIVTDYERPQRSELCLNGKWQFQPVALPEGYPWNRGNVPVLDLPKSDKWEAVPIKIPSAWNVNNWGLWAQPQKYDPVPLYFPSYPDSWKHARMGWLRKSFTIPSDWKGRRLILHFDGVAGECCVTLNGKKVVDSHYDTFTPFEANITDQADWTGENELLVGVRAHRLLNQTHPKYKWGWDAMGPRGSDMFDVCGIYQDVFLLGLPQVCVEDIFVKPWLDRDLLEIDVRVSNATNSTRTIQVGGVIRPWKNLAGDDTLTAPEQKWTLETPVMTLAAETVELKPGEHKTITLCESVNGQLKQWGPGHPNLYGLVLNVKMDGKETDRKYIRFGWRQFKIKEGDLFLNGQKIRLYGDFMHPFSSFIMTRRTAWAWFTMIGDFGGNSVRPHAQPWPKFYIDMADEMGIVVLDEAGLFGSAGGFNMDQEQAWKNCRAGYEALIRRDRNSPSVMGWSFANEMFALALLNKIPDEEFDFYRAKLADLGQMAYGLDPTREWISCDGDEDLNGRLKVWSKHWGDGWKDKEKIDYGLPEKDSKPLMLGEYSGSYYGTPDRLDYLNGDRAYESYAGRVEALGIDIYELATGIARDKLDYFSASETVWFGLEHLNFGFHDFSHLPTEKDGVFFTRPYQEGEPGMQPERIGPFVTTLNPGWDPSLPLYKPLAMFEAMKASLATEKPFPFQSRIPFLERPDVPLPTFDSVQFIGDKQSSLHAFLNSYNLSLTDDASAKFVIIDAHTGLGIALDKMIVKSALSSGGTVLILLNDRGVDLDLLNTILPESVTLTDRQISSFVHGAENTQTAPFSLRELYFVEQEQKSHMMKCGLDGPFVKNSTILLKACDIDWSLFHTSENRKCGALVLYEKLHKPSGAALVEWTKGQGKILLCSIDTSRKSERITHFWKKLFGCLGVNMAGVTDRSDLKREETRPYDLLRDGPPK